MLRKIWLRKIWLRKIWLIAVMLAAFAAPAHAEIQTSLAGSMCGERGALVGLLKQQFGEEQEDAALQSEQTLVELFASEKGTWSILVSSPNGNSCVVAAGKGLVTQAKS